MWIKGSPENKFGPLAFIEGNKADSEVGLVGGKWYYNGADASAKINISENEWAKYEFKAKDFEWWSPNAKRPSSPMQLIGRPYLWFYFKLPKGEKTCTIKFCIDNIEVE
jgi:hypothetical protein